MTTALSLLFILLLSGLLLTAAVAPNRSAYSPFELKRRRQEGIDTKIDDLRERRLVDIESIRRIVISLLLICLAFVAVSGFGWWVGPLSTVLVVLTYGPLARNVLIIRFAQKLYDEQEARLLVFVQRHAGVFKLVRHSLPAKASVAIDSKDELEHIIAGAHNILSDDEMNLLKGSLRFKARQVGHIMTPKKDVFSIKKGEILGPLVLDDLHKSGHDSFPVTDTTELDGIVGVLRLRDVQTLDTNRRHTAKVETAMDPEVHFINADQSLTEALRMLLDSQQHMLIVNDDSQSMVGILTLEDIFNALFSKKR